MKHTETFAVSNRGGFENLCRSRIYEDMKNIFRFLGLVKNNLSRFVIIVFRILQ